jgi:DNA-binding transcriptional regulator YiaG
MRQSIMLYRKSAITVQQFLRENMEGAEDKIGKATSQRQYAYELKQQWNNALITLEKAGFELSYDDDSYPLCLRKESQGNSPKGYFNRLMQAKIQIIPPKQQSRKLIVSKPSKKISLSQEEKITGFDIKLAREEAKIKANVLAEYMNKSRAWLSQKETGKRSLTHKEGQKLLQAIRVLSKKPS